MHPDAPLYRTVSYCSDSRPSRGCGRLDQLGLADTETIRDDEYNVDVAHIRPHLRMNACLGILSLVHAGFCAICTRGVQVAGP